MVNTTTVKRKTKAPARRVIGLDGLRTLALIGVLLYHTFPAKLPGGFFGVLLFFVISGYLAAYSGISSLREKKFDILAYYKKRIVRIYPELIIVLFTTIGVMTMVDTSKMANTQGEVASVLLGYNNLWQIKMNADYFAQLSKSSPFTHLWYIAVLIQFELIWPWLLKGYEILRSRKQKGTGMLICLALTAASFLIMPIWAMITGSDGITVVYYHTATRIFALFAGVMTGLLHGERLHPFAQHLTQPKTAGIALTVYILIYCLLYKFASGTSMWVYYIGMALATLIACRMIEIVSIRKNHTGRYMDNIIAKMISRYSYEIYLWQYPVLMICGILRLSSLPWHYALQLLLIAVLSIWLYHANREIVKRIG